jgi:hypothetical protein
MSRHSLRAACLLAILCLVTAPAVAERDPRSDFDRDFSRTLPVKPGQKLDVEHSQGAVRITVQKGSEVRVKARITVSSSDADGAQKFGEGIVVTAEDTGGAIVVRTRYPEKKWTFSGTGHVSFSVDYDILVPETMPVTVRNKFGDINVDGLKADATLSTSNGRVAFHDGKGTLRIDTSFGAIEVVRNAGPVDVTGANGSIVVAEIGGPAVIRNRFGSISVRNIQGKTEISGGNGSIEVSNVTGDLTVTNSFGTVATTAITGDVSIRNNNGEVTLDGVSGAADVEGSFGKIRASKIKKSLRVRAQNGEVSASDVDGPADLRTSFGMAQADRIQGALTVENANGAVRASAVQGAASVRTSFSQVLLAGVGGRVDVDNSNGSIEVHAAPAKAGACAPMSLKNSFGPIRVFLPEGAGYTVDASTSFGKLRTELPLTITDSPSSPNASSLQGRIGDGKCPLTIADSNGNIELQKAK